MSIRQLPTPEPYVTFRIQTVDGKSLFISARSYYRTEGTYVFTSLSNKEIETHFMRGAMPPQTPILEVDSDCVLYIAQQEPLEQENPSLKRTSPRKKVDNSKKVR